MVVEDAVNGVKSGKAAGCFVVGITTSFPAQALKLVGADLIVPSFEALEAYLFEGIAARVAEHRKRVRYACRDRGIWPRLAPCDIQPPRSICVVFDAGSSVVVTVANEDSVRVQRGRAPVRVEPHSSLPDVTPDS